MMTTKKLKLVLLIYVLGGLALVTFAVASNLGIQRFIIYLVIWALIFVPLISYYRKLVRKEKRER